MRNIYAMAFVLLTQAGCMAVYSEKWAWHHEQTCSMSRVSLGCPQ